MKLTSSQVLIICLIAFVPCFPKTIEQINLLHKDIGNDLMSIRKEFTAAQPKVYSLLDRIDRMYNIAKISAEEAHVTKQELKDKLSDNKKLQCEISTLKNKLQTAEKELDKFAKKFTYLNKELQIEKVQTAILSREKNELDKEKDELQGEMTRLNVESRINTDNKKDIISESILSELTEDEKRTLLKTSQNLSLSSTSAPSSPR